MKTVIDLEGVNIGKQDWLKSTSKFVEIPFEEMDEESWSEEEIKEHNRIIDEAMASFESGKFTTQEDLEKEIEKW